MSRRHPPHTHGRRPAQLRRPARLVGSALILLVALAATLPAAALGQGASDPGRLERKWQLLEYRDANNKLRLVPPGIGATFLPFAGVIKGEGACSTFETGYTQTKESLVIDPPQIERLGCDITSQEVDDAFYRGLSSAATWSTNGSNADNDSILTLRDVVGDPIMTLTRARIPADPTIARWELARIGSIDGSIEPVIQGAEPWVEFLRGGRVVGSTGCGSFLGSYTTNDRTMRITDIASRLADCTPALQAQAREILETFDQITDFDVLPAGLVLEDPGGTTRMALVPAIDLGNRTWTPTELLGADGDILFDSARLNTSAVRFAGKRADGRSICRGFDGRSLRSGLALSAFDLKPTGGACPKPKKNDESSSQDVENAFLGALEKTSSHALRGSELELLDVEGRPVARLTPQSELIGPTWVLTGMDVTPKAKKQRLRKPKGDVQLTATFEDIGVIQGETGKNDYIAEFSTPGAAQVEILGSTVFGRTCDGKKSGTPLCTQERLFLTLLESADSFIVRPEDLRLFKGTRPVLKFVPAESIAVEE